MIYFGAFYFLAFLFLINSLIYIWQIHRPIRWVLGLVLFLMSLVSIIEAMFYSGDLIHFPYLLGSSPMITSITIAVFGVYLVLMLEDNDKWKKWAWLFFLYPAMEVVLFIQYFINNYHEIPENYERLHRLGKTLFFPSKISYYMEFSAGVITYIGTACFAIITFNPKKREKKIKKRFLATMLVLIGLSLTLLILHLYNFFIFGFGNNNAIYSKFPIYLGIGVAFIYFQIWPFYFKSGAIFFEANTFGLAEKLGRYLDNENTKKIDKALKNLINNEKIYLEEDINLSSLSSEAGVSVHQLSEYLNKHESMNFSQYINNLRIKEAIKLLVMHEKNIAEICYEIGFNTPATFYKAFKSFTGMTPKEWQKQAMKSRKKL